MGGGGGVEPIEVGGGEIIFVVEEAVYLRLIGDVLTACSEWSPWKIF